MGSGCSLRPPLRFSFTSDTGWALLTRGRPGPCRCPAREGSSGGAEQSGAGKEPPSPPRAGGAQALQRGPEHGRAGRGRGAQTGGEGPALARLLGAAGAGTGRRAPCARPWLRSAPAASPCPTRRVSKCGPQPCPGRGGSRGLADGPPRRQGQGQVLRQGRGWPGAARAARQVAPGSATSRARLGDSCLVLCCAALRAPPYKTRLPVPSVLLFERNFTWSSAMASPCPCGLDTGWKRWVTGGTLPGWRSGSPPQIQSPVGPLNLALGRFSGPFRPRGSAPRFLTRIVKSQCRNAFFPSPPSFLDGSKTSRKPSEMFKGSRS